MSKIVSVPLDRDSIGILRVALRDYARLHARKGDTEEAQRAQDLCLTFDVAYDLVPEVK